MPREKRDRCEVCLFASDPETSPVKGRLWCAKWARYSEVDDICRRFLRRDEDYRD